MPDEHDDCYGYEYDCPYYQDCYSKNKDVDDAERALAHFCDDCPMIMLEGRKVYADKDT